MQKNAIMQKVARVAFVVIIAAMLFLFFSNDFGLVDIHKASIVVAVGVDYGEEGYAVTAQAAVPTPAQGSGSTAYTQVTGKGATVADAVDDINSKTGFYPKLAFCNLIVLGESCASENLFTVLDYFYRNDYVPLTALVGMCGGSAQQLLSSKPADGSMSSSAIQRAMSEELKNSGNCSTVNLKLIAQDWGSPSAAAFMPYITTAQAGGGGTAPASGMGSSGGSSGGSEKSSEQKSAEFTCLTTAAFAGGKFVGVLDEEQAFALNLIRSNVRHAVINTVCEGVDYTVGLKNNSGTAKMEAEGEKPVLKIKFRALANIQATESRPAAKGSANSHLVSDEVLNCTADTIEKAFASLLNFCKSTSCDLVGAERMLCAYHNKLYKKLKGEVLSKMDTQYDVVIKSVR